jgi:hypothetical protein
LLRLNKSYGHNFSKGALESPQGMTPTRIPKLVSG